jgi:hypothetical protein
MEATMKKLLVLSSALLVLTASSAFAQFDLAWNNCYGIAGATQNMNYACDGSRVGIPFKAVMSFVCPIEAPQFVGIQAVLDIQAAAPTLPDFWRMGVSECNEGGVAFPISMLGVGTGATGACVNPWLGDNSGGGYDYASGFGGANRSRLRITLAKVTPSALNYGVNYLGNVVGIDPANEAGCAGCEVPACLVLNQYELYQVAGTPIDIYFMENKNIQQAIFWNGGDPSCAAATPAKNKTWGSVKSLYR